MTNFKECSFVVDKTSYTITKDDFISDTRNKSNVKISVNLLDDLFILKIDTVKALKEQSTQAYFELLKTLTVHKRKCTELSNIVGQIDLYISMAYHATKYNYCKPEIPHFENNNSMDNNSIDNNSIDMDNNSWVNVVELRHPTVEHNIQFVPQNLSLGEDIDNVGEPDGILLYGVNQSGKSCTMKSLGVAIIMAQAGLYVAATKFRYYPFKKLMTRILGNDNLDKGLSAYTVEMTELNSILTRSDKNTIILGDEICRGTESASAVSLVSASIMHLSNKKAKFIFATHLHELSQMSEITEIDTVKQYHLTVSHDDETDKIIYDRALEPGSGKCLYGLEVAKHLKLPMNVLNQAYNIRDKYYSDKHANISNTGTKVSNYNSDRIINKCAIKECQTSAQHTHHIRYQSEADANDYVTVSMHKNNKVNLVGLCETHHKEVHNGNNGKQLVIYGYQSNSTTLNYTQRTLIKSLL